MDYIIREVKDFYRVIKLREFRKTEGVSFDIMIESMVPKIDAIDRVLHEKNAISPGSVENIQRPWYMHLHQEDNLFVLHGKRKVELYMPKYGKIESFVITPDYIEHNGNRILEGGGLIAWSTDVFHRIESGEEGSASINLATHHRGFDLKTNFNIYNLHIDTGEYEVLRKGYEDQK